MNEEKLDQEKNNLTDISHKDRRCFWLNKI